MFEGFFRETIDGVNAIKLKALLEQRNMITTSSRYTTLFPPVEIGSITLVDQIVILALAELVRPSKIVEIGTYLGYTTALLAMNVTNASIFSIDLPRDAENNSWQFDKQKIYQNDKDNDNFLRSKQYIEGEKYLRELSESERQRIFLIKKDSTKMDFRREFGSSEFVFIDGGHDMQTISQDTLNARGIVKRGVIIWHDYESKIHGDVTTFLAAETGRKIFHVLGSLCAFELIGYQG